MFYNGKSESFHESYFGSGRYSSEAKIGPVVARASRHVKRQRYKSSRRERAPDLIDRCQVRPCSRRWCRRQQMPALSQLEPVFSLCAHAAQKPAGPPRQRRRNAEANAVIQVASPHRKRSQIPTRVRCANWLLIISSAFLMLAGASMLPKLSAWMPPVMK